jgi:hypothetical protein
MLIDLVEHSKCPIYDFWKEYLPYGDPIAILDLEGIGNTEEYIKLKMNPTARNRWRYSSKHYITRIADRNQYLDGIYEINTSSEIRQNNPMRDSYLERPKAVNLKITCKDHFYSFLGCFSAEDKLVAYSTLQFAGELCATTQIIGHANYLKDDVMLNLFAGVVGQALIYRSKCIVYSRWADGTDGLRHWKYSVGFEPGLLTLK